MARRARMGGGTETGRKKGGRKKGTTNGTKGTNGERWRDGGMEGWMRDGCRPFGDEIGRKIGEEGARGAGVGERGTLNAER
jgi:hypothetical protein